MKKNKLYRKMIPIAGIMLAFVLAACENGTTPDGDNGPALTVRYETVPYESAEGGDSYVLVESLKQYDDSVHYYIYYMGYINSVPIAYKTNYFFDPSYMESMTVSYDRSWTTEETVTNSLTKAKEETWNVNASVTAGMEIGTEAGVAPFATGSIKASVSATLGGGYGENISTSNTYETSKTYSESYTEGIQTVLGKDSPRGTYRYALMGVTDVFCMFEVDPETHKTTSVRIINTARESAYRWGLEYVPEINANFGKTGGGDKFEIPDIDFSQVPVPTVATNKPPPPPPPPPPTIEEGSFLYELRKLGGATKVNNNADASMDTKKDTEVKFTLTIKAEKADWNEGVGAYRAVKVTYTYDVYEQKGDKTQLQISGEEIIPLDFNLAELKGITTETRSGTVSGEQHDWVAYQPDANRGPDDFIHYTQTRVDGPGGNDQNNVGFYGMLKIFYVRNL